VEPDSDPEAAKDSAGIVKYVRERARPGSIILLHVMYPGREESLKAVPGIVDALAAGGYGFVTVSELLAAAD
jgi:peptidoglycan/xylan/chitin deacetylase (PgdA/CDA1 family)